jgi:hypothetical protein
VVTLDEQVLLNEIEGAQGAYSSDGSLKRQLLKLETQTVIQTNHRGQYSLKQSDYCGFYNNNQNWFDE